MKKFKKGDRIRIIKSNEPKYIGLEGTFISYDMYFIIKLDKHSTSTGLVNFYAKEDEIELIEPITWTPTFIIRRRLWTKPSE